MHRTRTSYFPLTTFKNTHFDTPQRAAESAVRIQREAKAAESAVIHSLAGSGGALLAFIILYPFDNLREQIQCSRQRLNFEKTWRLLARTVERDGVSGLYAGLRSHLLGIGTSWALFYYFYVFARNKATAWKSYKPITDLENLFLSLAAGAAAVVISNPIWVVSTREKLRQNKPGQGLLKNLLDIIEHEGVEKLFSGIGPSLIFLLNPAIQFTVYERLKQSLRNHREQQLLAKHAPSSSRLSLYPGIAARPDILRYGQHPQLATVSLKNLFSRFSGVNGSGSGLPAVGVLSGGYSSDSSSATSPEMRELLASSSMFHNINNLSRPRPKLTETDQILAGSLSKVVALLATYPFQVLKSRAHARMLLDDEEQPGEPVHDDSTLRCFFRLIEMEGVSGLYRGFTSKLLTSAAAAAIMLSAYEHLVSLLQSVSTWSRPVGYSRTGQREVPGRYRRRPSSH